MHPAPPVRLLGVLNLRPNTPQTQTVHLPELHMVVRRLQNAGAMKLCPYCDLPVNHASKHRVDPPAASSLPDEQVYRATIIALRQYWANRLQPDRDEYRRIAAEYLRLALNRMMTGGML
jgi:hypothetical protein